MSHEEEALPWAIRSRATGMTVRKFSSEFTARASWRELPHREVFEVMVWEDGRWVLPKA